MGVEVGSLDFERLIHASIDDLKAGRVNPYNSGKTKEKPSK